MQFPDDDNGQLLAEIAAAGIDLNKMHQVDLFYLNKKPMLKNLLKK